MHGPLVTSSHSTTARRILGLDLGKFNSTSCIDANRLKVPVTTSSFP